MQDPHYRTNCIFPLLYSCSEDYRGGLCAWGSGVGGEGLFWQSNLCYTNQTIWPTLVIKTKDSEEWGCEPLRTLFLLQLLKKPNNCSSSQFLKSALSVQQLCTGYLLKGSPFHLKSCGITQCKPPPFQAAAPPLTWKVKGGKFLKSHPNLISWKGECTTISWDFVLTQKLQMS